MKSQVQAFAVAVQFLTQLPVNFKSAPSKNAVGGSVVFYPWVGAILGVLLTLLASVLPDQHQLLSAALILMLWVWLTGALHLDGLADSADAWLGGGDDKQRTLLIMKDPTAGPVAVVILCLLLLLKFTALIALLNLQLHSWLIAVLVLGRLSVPVLLMTTPYVSSQGLGSWLVKYMPKGRVLLSLLLAVTLLSLMFGGVLWLVILLCISVGWLLRRLMIKRIDGTTGDTIGALVEITETVAIIGIVLLSSG